MELDDTQALRALTAEGHLPSLLILSRDPALIDTVRKAAPTGMAIRDAASVDDVADRMSASESGVLLVDSSGTNDIGGMLAQLTQHFPEMVAVVAGKREDSGALLRLTAEGRVFRFLLTPLSHGQTRLALKSAAAQHIDLKASSSRRLAVAPAAPKRNYVATYGALAAGLLVVIVAVWFGVSRLTVEPQAPTTAERSATQSPNALPARLDPVSAELASAKEAFDAGRYLEPRGDSVLDYYRSALALEPNNAQAKAGVRSVAEKILERAEAALTAERIEEAVRSVETARDIDPTHPRFAFLDVQIGRERERMKLTQARGVDQRIRALVAQAAEYVRNGRLITPAAGNARAALIEARKLDPTDPAVAQGTRDLIASLTSEAREALAAGKLKDAEVFVDAARQLGAAGVALTTIERQLADALKGPAPTQTAEAPPKPTPTAAPPVTAPVAASVEPPVAAPVERDVTPAQSSVNTAPIQAASVPRTREVAAQYPRQALLSAIEGWVDLEFTISPTGEPTNITIKGSQPRRTFDRAAVEALGKWRFQPIVRDGVPVAQPAVLRMTFKPN